MKFRQFIMLSAALFCLSLLLPQTAYSAGEPTLVGGVITRDARTYRICLQDFKNHFNGYMYGINQILSMRDSRRVESFRSQLPSVQIELLKEFLASIPNTYVNSCRITEISEEFKEVKQRKSFRQEYELISGKKWEDGCQLHHIIPIELNGSNESFNFIQLSQKEHKLFTNFLRFVVPWLQGKTLTQNGREIRAYLEAKYGGQVYAPKKEEQYSVVDLYWDWLDLRH